MSKTTSQRLRFFLGAPAPPVTSLTQKLHPATASIDGANLIVAAWTYLGRYSIITNRNAEKNQAAEMIRKPPM
jgi:hypothetical protein